jgi:hypothetical protein
MMPDERVRKKKQIQGEEGEKYLLFIRLWAYIVFRSFPQPGTILDLVELPASPLQIIG